MSGTERPWGTTSQPVPIPASWRRWIRPSSGGSDATQFVSGVELLQFGIYRGIGLADWYHMLNTGYRFPCVGASDYPACRFLSDCRTYASHVPQDKPADAARAPLPSFPEWLRGAAEGRSFVTTGPLLLLEVDGRRPGETIGHKAAGVVKHTISARLRCEVVPV